MTTSEHWPTTPTWWVHTWLGSLLKGHWSTFRQAWTESMTVSLLYLRWTWLFWGKTWASRSLLAPRWTDAAPWRRRCAPWWRAWAWAVPSSTTSPPTTNCWGRCTAAPTSAGNRSTSSGGTWTCDGRKASSASHLFSLAFYLEQLISTLNRSLAGNQRGTAGYSLYVCISSATPLSLLL